MPAPDDRARLSEPLRKRIAELLGRYPEPGAAMLPILHAVQEEKGHFDPPLVAALSKETGFTAEKIWGVVSFYTMFRRQPVGRYHIMACRTLSCALRGAEDLLGLLRDRYGLRHGEVSADGLFSLEEAECLAACSDAPALQINGELHTRLDREKLAALLDGLRQKGGR
jgi:NADH-quinone oxidoreductase subunit E